MGTGHLMRCLAFAQALETNGYDVTFFTFCESETLYQHLLNEGFRVIPLEGHYPNQIDWQRTSDVLQSFPDAWLVLDGYHFDSAYQRRIKESGHHLFVIDDTAHLDQYHGDIVLNQNLNADGLDYSAEPFTRFLLGPRYAMLRHEFLNLHDTQCNIPRVAGKILITLGGGDDKNQTLRVIRALQTVEVGGLEAVVVVGAANPQRAEIESEADQSKFPIRLKYNAGNMPELMEWADLAICAGGTTCWELAFMGVPMLVTILADNQQANVEALETEGVAVNLGWYASLSRDKIAQIITETAKTAHVRAQMSRRGHFLVDGKGIERVLAELAAR
jgi:UDP-2,4-diacetamido-2,4,6-trideoxy-beta-L-altropyranose hydrolase